MIREGGIVGGGEGRGGSDCHLGRFALFEQVNTHSQEQTEKVDDGQGKERFRAGGSDEREIL